MTKRENKVIFESCGCKIFNNQNQLIAKTTMIGNMYKLNCPENKVVTLVKSGNDCNLWHRRFGHISGGNLQKLAKDLVSGINIQEVDLKSCRSEICIKGKQSRLPFKNVGNRAKQILELVHSDLDRCSKNLSEVHDTS